MTVWVWVVAAIVELVIDCRVEMDKKPLKVAYLMIPELLVAIELDQLQLLVELDSVHGLQYKK